MKRNKPLFISLCVVSGLIIFVSFCCMMFFMFIFGPDIGRGDYYADPNNYRELDCKIVEVDTDYDGKSIYLSLEHNSDEFEDGENFVINGENLRVARENGVNDILKKDNVITVKAAPGEFSGPGSGYSIAGLSCGGKDYLPFEVGLNNIAQWKYASSHNGTVTVSVSAAILVFGLLLLGANFIIFFKSKKPTAQSNADGVKK